MSKETNYGNIDNFPERIREVVDAIGNANKVSKLANVTPSSIARWLKGESDPSRTNLIALATAASVNLEWLATGSGPKTSEDIPNKQADASKHCTYDTNGKEVDLNDFVFVPRYDIEAAAGHGYLVEDEQSPYAVAFRRFWIINFLHANPKDLSCISVKGDSMEGVLNDRDLILVNHAKNHPGDGLYVIRIGADLIVKRTQTMPGNKLLVTSANEAYAPFEIDLARYEDDIAIVGKVEWYGRQV